MLGVDWWCLFSWVVLVVHAGVCCCAKVAVIAGACRCRPMHATVPGDCGCGLLMLAGAISFGHCSTQFTRCFCYLVYVAIRSSFKNDPLKKASSRFLNQEIIGSGCCRVYVEHALFLVWSGLVSGLFVRGVVAVSGEKDVHFESY